MNIIQKTLFPPVGFPEDLYLRCRSAEHMTSVVPTLDDQGNEGLDLARKDILSTDTFFGSLYWDYWRQFTSVRQIALSLKVTGAGKLRVLEDTGKGIVLVMRQKVRSDGTEPVLIPLPFTGLTSGPFDSTARGSRIFVEFEATESSRLSALDFVTEQVPDADTSLSIGLCTFNQETYFARTLASIASLAARLEGLKQVYIINQDRKSVV